MTFEKPDYWFLLSYARRDSAGEDHVYSFYHDLAQSIAMAKGLPTDVSTEQIGFLDTSNIAPGTAWPQEVAQALQTCRTFICLYSPAFFNSPRLGQ